MTGDISKMTRYVVQADSSGKIHYAEQLLRGNTFLCYGYCEGTPQPANYDRDQLERHFKKHYDPRRAANAPNQGD